VTTQPTTTTEQATTAATTTEKEMTKEPDSPSEEVSKDEEDKGTKGKSGSMSSYKYVEENWSGEVRGRCEECRCLGDDDCFCYCEDGIQ